MQDANIKILQPYTPKGHQHQDYTDQYKGNGKQLLQGGKPQPQQHKKQCQQLSHQHHANTQAPQTYTQKGHQHQAHTQPKGNVKQKVHRNSFRGGSPNYNNTKSKANNFHTNS